LKSMMVNFSSFLGHHNHQIWTSLNDSGQFWRLEHLPWPEESPHLNIIEPLVSFRD
jgi:hypothetical protein